MNTENKEKLTFFLYVRKSSESEDRQVQSIDDQIRVLLPLAQTLNIRIKETFTEAKSAKAPFVRPVFTEMLARIEKGEANGILVWELNRLSRNPVDSGTISWMLQRGVLKCIQTMSKKYLPSDNILLFNVETGMANQFIIDLRRNCRRGMEGKALRGWKPALAPYGYLNDKLEGTIIPDKKRFHLIRRMWDMMLSGNYTAPQIRNIANKEWGYRTPKRKQRGGDEISNSGIYKMFTNVFYSGLFMWAGTLYQGKHKPMITLDEYDRVQVLLGRDGKPRAKTHNFAYTGMISCGVCSSMYTATEKTKFIKRTKEFRNYIYYHCTRRKRGAVCLNSKPLKLNVLEDQIEKEIEQYDSLPYFEEMAVEILHGLAQENINDKLQIEAMQKKSMSEAQKELDNLTRMRYKELIDDEIFAKEKELLSGKILRIKAQLDTCDEREKLINELTERAFSYVAHARNSFKKGSLIEKREVASALGSNFSITGKKLNIEASVWLIPIQKAYPVLLAEFKRLELEKTLTDKERNVILTHVRLQLCATVQEVKTIFIKLNDTGIKIPLLKPPE